MPTSTRKKWPFYGGLPAKPRSFSILHRRGRCPHRPARNDRFMAVFRRNRVDFLFYAVGADDPVRPPENALFHGKPMRNRNIFNGPMWASAPTIGHENSTNFEGGQSRPPLQRVLKITRVMRKIAASPVCTIDFHTSNIGRHHGVSGARNRPVLQTPGAFVKSIFYVVGVDAHIDPQETAVLWRFSGKSVLVFISRRRGGRPCPPAGKCPFSRKTDAKSQHFQWADVGIGPYNRPRKFNEF